MEVFKPAWLDSGATTPINSIDVQPGSLRFATGARTGVSIWLTAPLLSPALEACAGAREPLFVGKLHEGEVTTVRWSPRGNALASAGEDRAIIVWHLRSSASAAVRSTLERTAEHWTPSLMLKEGHTLDVTTLSWHPSGSFLVSGGKDTRVCVWPAATIAGGAARTISRPLLTLTEHHSFVEAVAWDPLGGSLASFGHDGELLIWEAEGFLRAATAALSEPEHGGTATDTEFPDKPRHRFKYSAAAAEAATVAGPDLGLVLALHGGPFVAGHEVPALRMDWSPSGEVLVACKGLAGGGDRFTAALVSRLAPMAIEEHILGHRAAVTAARFFPTPLQLTPLLQPVAPDGGGDQGTLGGKRPRAAASTDTGGAAAEGAAVPRAGPQAPQLATALALASADGRLTVWSSARRDAPCIELRRAFGGPITDLAWGAAMLPREDQRGDAAAAEESGCVGAAPFLIASSIDGSVAVVLFGRTAAPPAAKKKAPPGADAAGAANAQLSDMDAGDEPAAAASRAPPVGSSALGFVPTADVAFAGMCRLYGLSLEDFAAERGEERLSGDALTEGQGGRVTEAALRQWLQGQCAWLGAVTSRRVRRALRLPRAAEAPSRSMLAVLLRAAEAAAAARLGGGGDDAGDGDGTAQRGGLFFPEPAAGGGAAQPHPALPPQPQSAALLLLTQQVAPTAPEDAARATAVQLAQAESRKRGKRRIAPVLVDDLPPPLTTAATAPPADGDAAADPPAAHAAAPVAALPAASASSASFAAAEARRWAAAWGAAPQPTAPGVAAAAVAGSDLAAVELVPWLSSESLRRRLARSGGAAPGPGAAAAAALGHAPWPPHF